MARHTVDPNLTALASGHSDQQYKFSLEQNNKQVQGKGVHDADDLTFSSKLRAKEHS